MVVGLECKKKLQSSDFLLTECRLSWHAFLTPKLGWFSKPVVCVALMLTPVLQAHSTVVVNPVSAVGA
eukprot:312033-Amphidinium_carterae.1